MNLVLLTVRLLFGADDAPKKPQSARPTAIVIKVKGMVTAKGRDGQRPVGPGEYFLPGETVAAAADAEAMLVFLVPNERRRLRAGASATLTRDGCEPAHAVEPAGPTKLSRKNLTKVREVEVREGGGVGVLRGGEPTTEARTTPLFGTFILTTRPTFTWPPVARAEAYGVELKDGAGRVWKVDTREARLDYPAKEKPLQLGQKYLWSVNARLSGGEEKIVVDESNFKLVLKGESEALVPVRKLAESDDAEDLLLAAAAYEGYGVLDEALRVFEKLAQVQRGVACY
jgi:hypothetical protein